MKCRFVCFSRNISPSPYGYGITWRRYTPEENNYVVLKTDNNLPPQQSVLQSPETDFISRYRISLWNDLLPKMLNITHPVIKSIRNNVTGLHLTNGNFYKFYFRTVKDSYTETFITLLNIIKIVICC